MKSCESARGLTPSLQHQWIGLVATAESDGWTKIRKRCGPVLGDGVVEGLLQKDSDGSCLPICHGDGMKLVN